MANLFVSLRFSGVLKYVNTRTADSLLKLFWSTIDKKFESAKSSITKHYTEFERSCKYSVDSTLVNNTQAMIQMLPAVTVLPAASEKLFEVPFLRNPHFAERDTEVELVRTSLTQPKPPHDIRSTICLLQGLGGVGKTTIALEYAFKYGGEYDFVFWIPARTELDVLNTATALARKLQIGAQYLETQQQPRSRAEVFLSWLQTLGSSPDASITTLTLIFGRQALASYFRQCRRTINCDANLADKWPGPYLTNFPKFQTRSLLFVKHRGLSTRQFCWIPSVSRIPNSSSKFSFSAHSKSKVVRPH